MQTRYNVQKIESKWYKHWLKKKYFLADNSSLKKPFTMVMPPPNITGSLHLGHILQHTISDIIIRFKRMQGFDVLWLPGVDHAGIQMQTTVEKKLKKETGKSRQDLGRKKFLEYLWQCKKEWYEIQKKQMQKIGESADWSREKFTLDPGPKKAVQEEFFHFFKQGQIYYGAYLVNWCPHCQTALMEVETEYLPCKDKLYYLKYQIVDSDYSLTIATVRPETIFADTAAAVNPRDKRYKNLIGKEILVPLLNKKVPIIADPDVDPSFGSGVLKITPGHSFNDYQIGKKHNLKIINSINRQGRLSLEHISKKLAKSPYHNLKVREARKAVVQELEKKKIIERKETYLHNVQVCERCKINIEPLISEEWFVKMKGLAQPALQAIKAEEVKFIPLKRKKMALSWLISIRDWCISRSLWWGHPIPIFYCEKCKENWENIYQNFQKDKIWTQKSLPGIFCSKTDLQKCPACSQPIKQEKRVLDTWFSSALWPFSALGWPAQTQDLKRYYPSDLMVTAGEILYLWICRMIILGLHFMHQAPFRKVFIHGTLRDAKGQKMSKSLGNGVDPLEMIEKYSADALRFSMARLTKPGRDIRMSKQAMEAEIRTSRNFMTKIWNISRFILSNRIKLNSLSKNQSLPSDLHSSLTIPDQWILARLNQTIRRVTIYLNNYQTSRAANRIYNFIWKELADWYLEAVKKDIYGKNEKRKKIISTLLCSILTNSLKLLHPFCPFISEEIWQKIKTKADKDLIIAEWPQEFTILIDQDKVLKFKKAKALVEKQRKNKKLDQKDKNALKDPEIKKLVKIL